MECSFLLLIVIESIVFVFVVFIKWAGVGATVFCGAGPGTIIPGTCAAPIATGTILTIGTTTMGFGCCWSPHSLFPCPNSFGPWTTGQRYGRYITPVSGSAMKIAVPKKERGREIGR